MNLNRKVVPLFGNNEPSTSSGTANSKETTLQDIIDTAINHDIISDKDTFKVYQALMEMRGSSDQAATTTGEERAPNMDWQEKYFSKLDSDVSEMKNSLISATEHIGQMINQTLSEMRDRDNQRHAEILAIRTDVQAIRTDNAETRRWIIGMVIAAIGVSLSAIIGIVAIVAN
jgi:hypothetical protein